MKFSDMPPIMSTFWRNEGNTLHPYQNKINDTIMYPQKFMFSLSLPYNTTDINYNF